MFRKALTAALAALLINLAAAGSPALAARQAAKDPAEVVKEKVARFGEGALVKVKMKDGAKLKGRVGESDGEGFMLVDAKGARTRVAYSQAEGIKRIDESGGRPFKGKEAAIVGGLVVGIFAAVILMLKHSD
jgi:hypothetical protein